jgi:hypothetical protein
MTTSGWSALVQTLQSFSSAQGKAQGILARLLIRELEEAIRSRLGTSSKSGEAGGTENRPHPHGQTDRRGSIEASKPR